MFLKTASLFILLTIACTAVLSAVWIAPAKKVNPPTTTTQTLSPSTTPVKKTTRINTPAPSKTEEPWGVSKQVSENTWTMKVSEDKKIGAPQEILNALNDYRQKKGVGTLSWDDKLASFAQSRAETFTASGGLDNHAGFNEYFKNEEGLKQIGFFGVGENSSYGFQMEAVHLIEWVYAGDAPHDNNQLDPSWTHVGIGVKGNATDLVFGKNKI